MMSYLGNVGLVFGLEVHCMPFIVQFPLALPIGQNLKNFGISGGFVEPIIGFRVNRLEVIVFIDRLRPKVYQHPTHFDPFQYIGG